MLVYSTMWRGIDSQACLGGEFVRVPTIGVHMTKRGWGSSIAEKMHELVNTFGVSDMEAGNWLVLEEYILKPVKKLYILPELDRISFCSG